MQDESYHTTRRTTNFVEPAPIVRPWRQEITPAAPQEVILRAPVEPESVAVSETDRAVAFSISTAGLALIVGVGGLLVAVVGWQVPLLSVSALAVFFGLAAVIWFGAWLFHNLASPDGIGLLGIVLQYKLLRYEQRARLDRLDDMIRGEDDTWGAQ